MSTQPSQPTRTALALVAALALTACQAADGAGDGDGDGDGEPPVPQTLTIVSSDWNGWDRDHRPTPETATLPVEVGATVSVDGTGFEVTEVDSGEITVSTDDDLAPEGETGGSNMNDLVDELTVVTGEETRAATPTLDGGYHYVLTLTQD